MTRSAGTLSVGAIAVAASASAIGCDEPAQPKPAPSASSATASRPPSSSGASASAVPTVAQPPCRAIQVIGLVADAAGRQVARGQAIRGRTWIDVKESSKLTIKDTRSGRELTIEGPAHLMPCYYEEERFLVSKGRVVTASGVGVRPGAEAIVATPHGSIRYGDAKAVIEVDEKRLAVSVTTGRAWVSPVEGAQRVGDDPVAGPKGKATVRGTQKTTDPDARAKACEKAAATAAASAENVLNPTGPDAGKLGKRAAEQFRARQAARAACSVAAAAVGRVEDPKERLRVWALVARSEKRWRAVPKAKK